VAGLTGICILQRKTAAQKGLPEKTPVASDALSFWGFECLSRSLWEFS
jgi:hypothetical protein